MRILLLTLYFAPDFAANAVIMSQLTEELAKLGHQVTVVTAMPHYDQGRIWQGYKGKLVHKEEGESVTVFRTYLFVPSNKRNILGRAVSYVSFHILSTILASLSGRPDAILVPSPPLTIGLCAYIVSRLTKAPYVYNVQDVYPDAAVRLGVLRNPRLIRLFRSVEDFIYRKAAAVSVISEDFRSNLASKGVPPSKLAVIPNFVDIDFIRVLPRINPFSARHGLNDDFVVLFAGNIGLSHSVETLLEAADRLRDLNRLRILVVGGGAQYATMVQGAAARGLVNLKFLPFQPTEDVPMMYASADASLVLLRKGMSAESTPSRAYTILASGRPLIACVDAGSEVWRIVQEGECGVCVPPEEPVALADAVRTLYSNTLLCDRLGINGRKYVEKHYTREKVGEQYAQLLARVSQRAPSR